MSDKDAIAMAHEAAWTPAAQAAIDKHRLWLLMHLRGTTWRATATQQDGEAWLGRIRGQPIRVIWSIASELDGQCWLHVSASHQARLPTWREMCEVKEAFIGAERWACQLHPPETNYVDQAEVLHLWSPLTSWPLPDFTRGTGSI